MTPEIELELSNGNLHETEYYHNVISKNNDCIPRFAWYFAAVLYVSSIAFAVYKLAF